MDAATEILSLVRQGRFARCVELARSLENDPTAAAVTKASLMAVVQCGSWADRKHVIRSLRGFSPETKSEILRALVVVFAESLETGDDHSGREAAALWLATSLIGFEKKLAAEALPRFEHCIESAELRERLARMAVR